MGLTRVCRSCDATSNVPDAATACPVCGQSFGPPTFGLDYDPSEPWQTDSDAVRDARFEQSLRDALKEGLLRDT